MRPGGTLGQRPQLELLRWPWDVQTPPPGGWQGVQRPLPSWPRGRGVATRPTCAPPLSPGAGLRALAPRETPA
eukprot:6879537-Pyramimonas_sp.AAC.1